MNEELVNLVTKLYQETSLVVKPMFPKVLVRLLPREQQTKTGLWMPEGAQNKPVHEGIVLETYKPFWHSVWKSKKSYVVVTAPALLDDKEHLRAIWQECAVQPGDHVIFPHLALGITPVWPLDDGRGDYRLVPEGEILGKVDYEKESVHQWLIRIIREVDVQWARDIADRILREADVIKKDQKSMTVSGR